MHTDSIVESIRATSSSEKDQKKNKNKKKGSRRQKKEERSGSYSSDGVRTKQDRNALPAQWRKDKEADSDNEQKDKKREKKALDQRGRSKTYNDLDQTNMKKKKGKNKEKEVKIIPISNGGGNPWKKKMHLTSEDVATEWSLLAALPAGMRKEMLPRLHLGLAGDLDGGWDLSSTSSETKTTRTLPDDGNSFSSSSESEEEINETGHPQGKIDLGNQKAEKPPQPPKEKLKQAAVQEEAAVAQGIPLTSREAPKKADESPIRGSLTARESTRGEARVEELRQQFYARYPPRQVKNSSSGSVETRKGALSPAVTRSLERCRISITDADINVETLPEHQARDPALGAERSVSYEEMRARFLREALESNSDAESSPEVTRRKKVDVGIHERQSEAPTLPISTEPQADDKDSPPSTKATDYEEEMRKKDEIIKQLQKENRELKLKNMALEELLMQAALPKRKEGVN